MLDFLGTLQRTHSCGQLRVQQAGEQVILMGWVNRRRDHGNLIFLDLRDRTGITQIVLDKDLTPDGHAKAEQVRPEYVVAVVGKVRLRGRDVINPKMATGEIEVAAEQLLVLNDSRVPPFSPAEEAIANEELRLKYRYIDLRRQQMQQNFELRHKITRAVRESLSSQGFLEIETPFMTRSTPEGARDYLVPSRVHGGHFYALPQSPQLFKQILMISGFDRYFQIVRCFRDEDLRADRQPEFTQLDLEFAFVEEKDVQDFVEALIRHVFKEVIDVELAATFPRMTWEEAMRRFGSDKPDLRIALELADVADALKHVEFKVFAEPANDPAGRVAALRLPGGATLSRKEIDQLTEYVAKYGAKGLAWIKVEDLAKGREGVNSPVAKFLDDAALDAVLKATGAQSGDMVFVGAGKWKTVTDFMGALRLKVGKDRGLVENSWKPLWVTDFPMFEYDEEEKRFVALHHPFTAPKVDDIAELRANASNAVSRGYDMVLNGNEIGGGSIRIHRPDMQSAVFDLLGISAEEAEMKFGFLLKALKFGAPPHGGLAFGIDRIAALMAGTESIRDVIPFPKTTSAQDLMTDAPSMVGAAQLKELHVAVAVTENGKG